MEYIAFILFGVGVLLMAVAYLFNHDKNKEHLLALNNKNSFARAQNTVYQQPLSQAPIQPQFTEPATARHAYVNVENRAQVPSSNLGSPPTSSPAIVNTLEQPNIPKLELNQQSAPQVDVIVQQQNPKFFEKTAYLYTDSSPNNRYIGTEVSFNMHDVNGIRRFSNGVFSYDGFIFQFDHQSGTERFKLENIDHISFYPNCVVLVLKNNLPTALVFVDESKSIQKILETFKVDKQN